ncbi:EamA family transporter [Paenibacillus sp. FSL A5-0031]|uniref:DMT family transporter n=1 Tax=Paenibacillus sp. FSL A5-0031 TaxID=1920420 RepID=UPI00096D08A2|nr:DMT family transporter [Paenibacillus sp. FSL A5-0031]OME78356.1 EamA family transporter [Paenibacillus sp. FSL A5-0031]
MKPLKADFLILMITLCWGSSYIFMKLGLNSIEEFNLIALRCGFAFLLSAALFHKSLRHTDLKTLKYAALLGLLLFGVFTGIMFGLKTTTTSNAGFLISLTVIFVPLIYVTVFKKKLKLSLVIGVFLAIIGIGFLTLNSELRIYPGDFLCIMGALLYAIHILITDSAAKTTNTLNLGILQLGFAGAYGLFFSFLFETPKLPNTSEGWVAVLVLSIVCSAFGYVVQPLAQKYTTPIRTGLIFSLEPLFAALFGFVFINEILPFKGYIGAALVLLGVLVSGWHGSNKKQKQLAVS